MSVFITCITAVSHFIVSNSCLKYSLQIVECLITNVETASSLFAIFKFFQSLSTFLGYLFVDKISINIQITSLGTAIEKKRK